MNKLISIILPIYNEEKVIPQLCKEFKKTISNIKKYDFEIIMVENGSLDNSFDLLINERESNKQIKIIQLVKNIGTDGALIAGLSFAQGDAAIVMMADLQEDPVLIPKFLSKWEEGFEIVYGIVTKREKVPFIRRAETYLYYKLMGLITRNLIVENASDFRLMDRKVYKLVTSMPEHNIFFRGLVSWTGYKQVGIRFKRLPRYAGKSKAYFTTAMKVAFNGIFSFSNIFVFIPLFFCGFSLLVFAFLILNKQYSTSLFVLMFSFTFILLSTLAEYSRRIYMELLNRPRFIIREKIGF